MLTGAGDRLTADRRATVDTVVEAPAPVQPIDLTDDATVTEVLDLAERVGEVVLASGTAVMDTTTQIEFIAATYGMTKCDIDVTYNAIRISVDRGPKLPPATTMRVVHYRSLDFTRLAAVDRLTRRIRRELVPPQEALAALDEITSAPHPYPRWSATVGWALMAAGVAFLLNGGWLIALLSFATTTLIDRTNRLLNRRGLPFFFQHIAGGMIAATPAVLISTFAKGLHLDPSLIIAAGIAVLLAGLQLVGAGEDAITGAPITASARMLEVIMMTGGIVAGIALTLRIAEVFEATVPTVDMTAASRDLTNLPLKLLAGAVTSGAFALACYAERRALTAAAFSGAAATVAYLLVQHFGFGPIVSSGVAATVVGLAGGLAARRALTPPLVIAVAGITPLLPGLRVYRGLYALLNDELLVGFNQLFSAFTVGLALAAGVTLGEWMARDLRRPRIVRRIGSLRRPRFATEQ
ncbi:threonine/serine exporter family protein [Nocardia sp. ET3-3]|uniref:Threonine/serine exporter family protein n=1 Tax=Nocardia terrae TaxID=2675851 RepID=A0A7K1V1J5_9NOCA|nr:threonine/serine exporter family protein [Nocardia terrae]MVU80506.1 threonine/serine exporter family protein [Nocardia terrae]